MRIDNKISICLINFKFVVEKNIIGYKYLRINETNAILYSSFYDNTILCLSIS